MTNSFEVMSFSNSPCNAPVDFFIFFYVYKYLYSNSENLNVCDGRMEKPFFHLLGDACMKMADLLRSFGKSSIWLGLEMMWSKLIYV